MCNVLSKVFEQPMENRGIVVWDVCGTLGSEEGSVLKNVGLVWIDNICNLLCQGALLNWVNDDFLSEPNERIVLRHQAIQTWRDKPAVVEQVALNNVFLWASKICLGSCAVRAQEIHQPREPREAVLHHWTFFWVQKNIVEKKKQKTPGKHCMVAASSCRGVPLYYVGDCISFFLNNLQLPFKDFQESGK